MTPAASKVPGSRTKKNKARYVRLFVSAWPSLVYRRGAPGFPETVDVEELYVHHKLCILRSVVRLALWAIRISPATQVFIFRGNWKMRSDEEPHGLAINWLTFKYIETKMTFSTILS